jgi:hypothetical protein
LIRNPDALSSVRDSR